jgi:hypothetical protein
MEDVLRHISEKSVWLSENPTFVHLRNPALDPRERLRFVPCTTHFIMTFADLCRFILPSGTPRDEFEKLADQNLTEESDHWKWFLADLRSLGLDPTLRFTDAVRFLWNDATAKSRVLSYELCRLSATLSSRQKLVMVLAIEATGKVALEAALPAGRDAQRMSGKKLIYFGGHHLESELGHTLAEDEVRALLATIALDASARNELVALVDRIFDLFAAFLDDAFGFISSGGTIEVEPARASF